MTWSGENNQIGNGAAICYVICSALINNILGIEFKSCRIFKIKKFNYE